MRHRFLPVPGGGLCNDCGRGEFNGNHEISQRDLAHDLRAGIYQHYKGAYYIVLGIATLSDNGFLMRLGKEGDVFYVVYIPLTPRQGGLENPQLKIRRLTEFTEFVEWPGGVEEPRFKYVGFQTQDFSG